MDSENLLKLLSQCQSGLDSLTIAKDLGVDHQKVVGVIKSLQSVGDVSIRRGVESKSFIIARLTQSELRLRVAHLISVIAVFLCGDCV